MAMLWMDRRMDREFAGGAGSPAEGSIPGIHRDEGVWSRGWWRACRTEQWLQGRGDGSPKTAPLMTSATSLWGPQYPHLKGGLALAQAPGTVEHLC